VTPRATQRLQFHKDFTFADAAALVPYFARLGISHLYASPIATARKGSLHGYDVVDATRINPELGGEDGFLGLVAALKRHSMGVIVDIVPNHMAASPENAWWMDVLIHGRASRHARSFDIDWDTDDQVFLPWLTRPLAEAEVAGEIDRLGLPRPGAYRLGWWRTANDRINWRRFFDINDLVCLRMEDDETFERVHALPLRLLAEGLIDGVRVDHIDGLADPAGYCRKLRQRIGTAYLVIEKILLAGETLPHAWQCDGTTGYDFMDQVSALQHDPAAAVPLADAWASISGRAPDFAPEEQAARREILARSFGAQLEACVDSFVRESPTEELSRPALRRALTELLAHFPVYRTYAVAERPEADEAFLVRAFAGARKTALPGDDWLLDLLLRWFRDPALPAEPLRRFQQLSAPVAAKSVEDTAFYRYGRLLSRNDVGFDPHRFASSPADFHALMQARLTAAPHAMLATATHDHKRGEDVRARLAVLSEQPQAWARHLKDWIARSPEALNPGDKAMLFQTVVGAWPLDLELDDTPGRAAFAQRLMGWQEKALREAKLRSDWSDPNDAYEKAARDFLLHLVAEDGDLGLLTSIFTFIQEIAAAGAVNGLSQLVLKLTVPGVPDIYQGTEYWDFSLVDPDNRRPVDYARRQASLGTTSVASALTSWRDGRVKQLVVQRLLSLRRAKPEVFSRGIYIPIKSGTNVVAFRRRLGDDAVTVAVPRLPTGLMSGLVGLSLQHGIFHGLCTDRELFDGLLPVRVFSTFSP
jgi:malto-oligosyltrehalose synthase